MTPATILLILNIIAALFDIVKDAPAVIDEAKSLLGKIAPHVDAANAEVKRSFEAAQTRLATLTAAAQPPPLPAGAVLIDAAEGRELLHHSV